MIECVDIFTIELVNAKTDNWKSNNNSISITNNCKQCKCHFVPYIDLPRTALFDLCFYDQKIFEFKTQTYNHNTLILLLANPLYEIEYLLLFKTF